MIKRYLVLLTWLAAGFSSSAQAQKVGPEFQVTTYTTGVQGMPEVTTDANGNSVMIWRSYQDGGRGFEGQYGIFGQRFDSGGNALGTEFQVNTYTTNVQDRPSVAADSSGNFVVVWNSNDGQDGDGSGIFGQRYDPTGSPVGSEFQVNTYTTAFQAWPSVASDANGNFVVVWHFVPHEGSNAGVRGRRYDSGGNALGPEFQVNTYTPGGQWNAEVASDANGNFVVVWQSDSQDGSASGIFGQRYEADGTPVGGEFQVNTHTTDNQEGADVASDADGNFVVVWRNGRRGSGEYGISGQRYDSRGNPVGSEFQVNTYVGFNGATRVASNATGDFEVVWSRSFGADEIILGQRYDKDGNRRGGEFQVNSDTPGPRYFPSVASAANENFIVVWQYGASYQDGDGSDAGIFGQRFCKSTTCAVQ